MTLGRLLLAWLVVAAWFYAATWLAAVLEAAATRPAGAPAIARWLLAWRPVEAALLTLLASLWFDSLGSGGWWLLFGLVGLLATSPALFAASRAPRVTAAVMVAELARYLVGGGLLAWRLA